MTITVVVSTHNRSQNLLRLLTSVQPFADEIVIVDSGSTDDTKTIAKKFTKKIFYKENNLMLNVNKNYGFSKATGDWILNLDDDEEVPPELAREIRSVLDRAPNDVNGYWLPRKNIIFGRWIRHGLWWPDRQLRLFRRGQGEFPEQHVHEYIAVSGKTETIDVPFLHYNYDSLDQYMEKMQHIYIPSELNKYEGAGYQVQWQDAIRFPVSDFVKIYFAESGYKDGVHGLVLAMLQAFYSFLIFAKLWERKRFPDTPVELGEVEREMKRAGKDISYWRHTAAIQSSSRLLSRLRHKILRHYGH